MRLTRALHTTQHSAGFFARFGFETQQITQDGYGSGMDRYDMTLNIGEAQRGRITHFLASQEADQAGMPP